MTDSCCAPNVNSTSRPTRAACPTNQQVGRVVDALTLKALLVIPLTAVSPDSDYRFCAAPDCPTVYYRVDGQQVFTEAELREPVYQKHRLAGDTVVCYCFQHTLQAIRVEIEQTGQSTAIERITAGIRAGQCACEIRNPQGACCLGNVRELVRRLTAELDPSVA